MYILILLITVGTVFYAEKTESKYLNRILCFDAVLLILLGSLRNVSVGFDLTSYNAYFTSNFYYDIEPGFVFLSRSIWKMGFDFRFFMLICQTLIVFPIFYLIKKYSSIKWLSVFVYQVLYLYANSFNIIRQSIAMSITVFAVVIFIESLKRSKSVTFYVYLNYIALILLASSFHISALVFLPLIFLIKKDVIKKSTIFLLSSLSIIVLVFNQKVINLLLVFLNREYYGSITLEFGPVTVAVLFMFLAIQWYFSNDFKRSIYKGTLLNFTVICLILVLVGIWIPNYARLIMYYYSLLIILLPNTISPSSIKLKKKEFIITMGILLLFYIMQLYYSDYGGVNPYIFLNIS